MNHIPKKDEDFTTEDYDGFTNYCCVKCQYSTLFWNLFVQHHQTGARHRHQWAFPKPLVPGEVQGEVGEPKTKELNY